MSLGVVGDPDDPFSGRAWVRTFENGHVEVLYRGGDGPSDTEQLNTWLADAGIENRVRSLRSFVGGGLREQRDENAESNAERAQRRARQRVRWCVKALGGDQMLTLTYRENQTDLALAKKHFQRFAAMCRREWSGWKYVAAPEPQKRGAWHWHVGVRGFQNYDKLRGFWWRAMGYRVAFSEEGKPVLLDGGDTPGNVQGNASRHRGRKARTWQADRMAAYLAKYVAKNLGEVETEGASYSASRGLTWRVERYAVRALSFPAVRVAVAALLSGASAVYEWTAPSRSVVWASGRLPLPPD